MQNRPSRPFVLAARSLPVLVLLAFPVQASAQRGAFDEDVPAVPAQGGKRPYAGPQYPGKPPPLDAGGRSSPFAGSPLVPQPDRAPRDGERPAASGTGFVATPGRLVTNNHVVENCARMVARNSKDVRRPARVLATDAQRDLALLAVPEDFGPPLTFRDSSPVRRGETVVTYGFPLAPLLSSGPALTAGDVSALTGLGDNPRNYTITAPIQPGNSGGPVLDSQGSVIGVVVTKLNAARVARMTGGDIPQNVNFAIKGSEALAFLRANNVRPRTAASTGPDLRNSDVGDIAHPSTVFLECYR